MAGKIHRENSLAEIVASRGEVVRPLGVLIAEGKDLVAGRLTTQLEGLGHRVLAVTTDAHAAVESAGRLHPDLILIDQHIPPLEGIEAARAILARHVIPLVLLIDYPSADLVGRAQETGILSYLLWPADATALEAAINVALERYRELQFLCAESGDLRQALHARPVVERAKKMVMRRLELGDADAFAYLRRQSWSTMTPLREVAANLLAAEQVLFGKLDLLGCVDTMLNVLVRPEGVPRGVA
ncbi:MAG: ANTAR domain-containing protein [Bacillati bacterium ANGP1]|uniref:ANTAR domain-containing protein n=1 Tax=Candidatus Segetimicrobium genomatis TaxID=2569760 RepID=A0A537IRN8_9BACT|nr:MAG: ANTAR domain-containing protein [Terrabacteria group bacterium ANGP1]